MHTFSPLENFAIQTIGDDIVIADGINISITNAALSMFGVNIIIIIIFSICLKKVSLIPSRLQMLVEIIYNLVYGITKEHLQRKTEIFFPYIFTIFLFILFSNLYGIIPYSFVINAQLIIPITLAIFIFVFATIYGIFKNGFMWIRIFIPNNIPIFLIPILFITSVISYISKSISTGIRLFANTIAVCIIIKVLGIITTYMETFKFVSIFFISIVFLLELTMVFVQAYLFTVLSCIIIKQANEFH